MSILSPNTIKANSLFDSSYKKTKITLTASIALVAISLLARIYQNRALFLVRKEINNTSAVSFAFVLYLLWNPRGDYLCSPEQLIKEIIEEGEVEKFKVLIKMGDYLNREDADTGDTPLHVAAREGQEAIARLLIENSADVNAANTDKNTPLHVAAREGQEAIAQLLIENSADVNAVGRLDRTPLYLAVAYDKKNIAELLINADANLNKVNCFGETPAHEAVNGKHVDILELLVEAKANLSIQDSQGRTPLHSYIFFEKNDEKIGELLIKNDADLNKANNQGDTPLHMAIEKGDLATVVLLVEAGADLSIQDSQKRTPLEAAKTSSNFNIASYLKKAKNDKTNQKQHILDRQLI